MATFAPEEFLRGSKLVSLKDTGKLVFFFFFLELRSVGRNKDF